MKLLSLYVISITIVLLSTATAWSQQRSHFGHLYDWCMKQQGTKIIAAAPFVYQYCLWNTTKGSGRKLAIARCNQGIPKAARNHVSCKVVFDGNRINDSDFARRIDSESNFSGSLTIFDDSTSKLQKTTGTLTLRRYSLSEGFDIRSVPLILHGDGIKVCEGKYHLRSSKYEISCFGRRFRATADRDKLVRDGSGYQALPSKLRMDHGGSWIEWSM